MENRGQSQNLNPSLPLPETDLLQTHFGQFCCANQRRNRPISPPRSKCFSDNPSMAVGPVLAVNVACCGSNSRIPVPGFPLRRRNLWMGSIEWIQQFRRDRLEDAANGDNVIVCTARRLSPNQSRRFIKDSACFSNFADSPLSQVQHS